MFTSLVWLSLAEISKVVMEYWTRYRPRWSIQKIQEGGFAENSVDAALSVQRKIFDALKAEGLRDRDQLVNQGITLYEKFLDELPLFQGDSRIPPIEQRLLRFDLNLLKEEGVYSQEKQVEDELLKRGLSPLWNPSWEWEDQLPLYSQDVPTTEEVTARENWLAKLKPSIATSSNAVRCGTKISESLDTERLCDIGTEYLFKKEYTQAMQFFLKAAEKGSAVAMRRIGYLYYTGMGVELDYGQAEKWFLKGAEKGDAKSQYNIGNMYANGDGRERDYQQALKWFLKAAENGEAGAENRIGSFYYFGLGVDQNYGKSMEWYLKAAHKGNAQAMRNVADQFHDGEGVKQDYQKSAEWYLRAAQLGNVNAQARLGDQYMSGDGVAQDFHKAMQWFSLAAKKNNASALNGIGILYVNGQGVSQDQCKAMEYFLKATDCGSSSARRNIGILYFSEGDVREECENLFHEYIQHADFQNDDQQEVVEYLEDLMKFRSLKD